MNEPGVMGDIARLIVLLHAASTWTMVGVILVVQVVHYPLFSSVGETSFAGYEGLHTQRITWIVAPLMLVELVSAIALVFLRPAHVSVALLWAGLGLLALIWLSTALVQVPLHRALALGFDETVHRKLLATNWVRTAAWLVRGVIAAWILHQYFGPLRETP